MAVTIYNRHRLRDVHIQMIHSFDTDTFDRLTNQTVMHSDVPVSMMYFLSVASLASGVQ